MVGFNRRTNELKSRISRQLKQQHHEHRYQKDDCIAEEVVTFPPLFSLKPLFHVVTLQINSGLAHRVSNGMLSSGQAAVWFLLGRSGSSCFLLSCSSAGCKMSLFNFQCRDFHAANITPSKCWGRLCAPTSHQMSPPCIWYLPALLSCSSVQFQPRTNPY